MRCPICEIELLQVNDPETHLLITQNKVDGHIHTHGDLDNKDPLQKMIDVASEEIGLEKIKSVLDKREIVFHNRQRIGDILMFTCGIRDFKKAFPDVRVNVISTASHIWDYNPYIDRTLIPTEENTLKIGPGKLTNSSNRLDWHFANAYRVSIEDALKVNIQQGESRPDIWFSEEEYNSPRLFEQPYWVICLTGEKSWGCKTYPFDRWQEFVNQNSDITFVQIGTSEDNPPRLQGKNIIDYVGKTQSKETGIRDLFKLFLNAEGSIGLVSFHMHLSGGLHKPCIVVAGAREPVSFTRYAGHQYLATDGCLPCGINACWHCDLKACKNLIEHNDIQIPKCVDLIVPEDLSRSLQLYYQGDRLKPTIPSTKPKLSNIVKNAPKPISTPTITSSTDISKYGMTWGGGCITDRDWEFIKSIVEKNKIKSVLEFGAGLSTLLLNDFGLVVETYETNEGWIKKIKELKPATNIILWDGISENIPEEKEYDLAFVDGPAGGKNREISTKLAAKYAKYVVIHDAHREFEMQWQDKYIKDNFKGPTKGGHRCHLWVKEESHLLTKPGGKLYFKASEPTTTTFVNDGTSLFQDDDFRKADISFPLIPIEVADNKIEKSPACKIWNTQVNKKFIKIVSTARGWGGQARSITTIMKFLQNAGHQVEFIPFRNSVGSSEFKEYIKKYLPAITVTESYNTVKEHCDVFFMYADDYVWEFTKPEIGDIFSDINTDRKIMMLNYRRGKVGQIDWTKGWDKYMFLCSQQENELLKILPDMKTKVLPPCTELAEFLKIQPNYNDGLRIMRHNSQGDTKFPKDIEKYINEILLRQDVSIHMMPGPSFVSESIRFRRFQKNVPPVSEFLGLGNLFWYSLPEGYMDMGPRVILEAMAAGLSVIADNWGGAPDRVTSECGWITSTKQEQVDIIKNITFNELQQKGEAAKQRAKDEFIPERWIEEILT
jgi:ADP-heptose:LPS heptosyltransferase